MFPIPAFALESNSRSLPSMRQSLRRSCAACAKSKLSCDRRTPRCSRCTRRNVQCVYVNEPLAAPEWRMGDPMKPFPECGSLSSYRFGSFDPFDSYPQTRLPREHVQRLIHSCTSFCNYDFFKSAMSSPIQSSARLLSNTIRSI